MGNLYPLHLTQPFPKITIQGISADILPHLTYLTYLTYLREVSIDKVGVHDLHTATNRPTTKRPKHRLLRDRDRCIEGTVYFCLLACLLAFHLCVYV